MNMKKDYKSNGNEMRNIAGVEEAKCFNIFEISKYLKKFA